MDLNLSYNLPHFIGILGGGQMGSGIARLFAQHGFQVLVYDISPISLSKKDIPATQILSDLQACQCIIEAVREDMQVKVKLFKELDELLDKTAIFLSNTSSLSITQLAQSTKRPGQFMGLHFMNPAEKMPLVELVHGEKTTPETVNVAQALCKRLEKVAIHTQDKPGFVVNRLLIPMINEAICTLSDGVATREDIDQAMILGARHPMGPLTLADFIGLDTCLAIMQTLYQGFKNPKYKPSTLLESHVQNGYLGKKSGKGFYEYKKS